MRSPSPAEADDNRVSRWYEQSTARRIALAMTLTGSFFVVELVYGVLSNSLALISDSLHMLSDLLSLIVAFTAARYSQRKQTEHYTYGWRRAEVVGGLVNGVFLLSVCLFILFESIDRFFSTPEIYNPLEVIIVASIGLVINILGLFIFHDHGDGHGHGHEHGSEAKKEDVRENALELRSNRVAEIEPCQNPQKARESRHKHHKNLNIHGVFLHILGDAFGSIGVLISGLIMEFTDVPWRFYVDPAASLFISVLIGCSAIPLIKRTSAVLLQGLPSSFDIKEMMDEMAKIKGVKSIHEFHVWQLVSSKFVASVHVVCEDLKHFSHISQEMKRILHSAGIHSTTIQPEFSYTDEESQPILCELVCGDVCAKSQCCAPNDSK